MKNKNLLANFLIAIIFFGCSPMAKTKINRITEKCSESNFNKAKDDDNLLRRFASDCGDVSNYYYKQAFIILKKSKETKKSLGKIKKTTSSKDELEPEIKNIIPNTEIQQIFENEIKQAIVLPIGVMGEISNTKKIIIYNKFLEVVSNDFDLIPQEEYERAEEEAFQQMDYEECTEDQCIRMIQEFLQVENMYKIQLIKDENDIQVSLTFIDLDKKLVQTDFCESCKTSDLINMINKLYLDLKKKR